MLGIDQDKPRHQASVNPKMTTVTTFSDTEVKLESHKNLNISAYSQFLQYRLVPVMDQELRIYRRPTKTIDTDLGMGIFYHDRSFTVKLSLYCKIRRPVCNYMDDVSRHVATSLGLILYTEGFTSI